MRNRFSHILDNQENILQTNSCNVYYTKLHKDHGISVKHYDAILASQDGKCAICGNEESSKGLALDHCHESGKVRELLCSRCNMVLGSINDNIELLAKMSAYIEKHKKSQ